jgi:hypothetical protein
MLKTKRQYSSNTGQSNWGWNGNCEKYMGGLTGTGLFVDYKVKTRSVTYN